MRFFVPSHEIEMYQDRVSSLEQELKQFREVGSANFDIANMLVEEVIAILDAPEKAHGLSTQEIAEIAYESVFQRRIDDAREELVAKYEQQHRKELYDQVLVNLEKVEGGTIAEEVRTKVETDPILAIELRDSARKELGARALGTIHSDITMHEQEVINKEAARQLGLDRLDVAFALDRELNLVSDDVMELIEVGDKLELSYEGAGKNATPLVFTWTRDAYGKEGWIWSKADKNITTTTSSRGFGVSGRKRFEPQGDVFVTLGVVNKDLETGKDVVQSNKIAVGLPLVVITATGDTITPMTGEWNSYHQVVESPQMVCISGTDFQTKDLVFTRSTDRTS